MPDRLVTHELGGDFPRGGREAEPHHGVSGRDDQVWRRSRAAEIRQPVRRTRPQSVPGSDAIEVFRSERRVVAREGFDDPLHAARIDP